MKKIKLFVMLFIAAITFFSCSEDTKKPEVKLSFTATPSADNPNKILLDNTSTGTEGAFVYWQYTVDGNTVVDKDGIEAAIYANPGTYVITLTAVTAGKVDQVSQTIVITTENKFTCDDANAVLLAGLCSNGAVGKTWIWSRLKGAYAVGPGSKFDSSSPVITSWFISDKDYFNSTNGASCVYDDEYTFKHDADHTYINKNNDSYLWIWSWANFELGTNNAAYKDGCYGNREPANPTWSLIYKKGTDGKDYPWLILSKKASIAMYEGASEYQILSITADKLSLRSLAKNPTSEVYGWRYYNLIRKGFVESPPTPEPDTPLKQAASFNVGMTVNSFNLTGKRSEILLREYDNITADYDMKMSFMYPNKGVYDFAAADKIVKYGTDNKLNVHGHTLIWHGSIPTWLKNFAGTDAEFETIIKDYITTVVTRYKGRVKSWDVVNEAIDDATGNPLRSSIFRQKMGPDYIKKCYQWARDADPSCKLFYNDYDIERSVTKRAAYFSIVDVLKASNLIDGCGEQMHISYNFPPASGIQAFTDAVVSRGLLVHFAELDIRANPKNDLTELTLDRAIAQQKKYEEVVKIFNAIPPANRYAITIWGMRDSESWLIDFWGNIDWPLLYDDGYEMKKAHTGFLDGLK